MATPARMPRRLAIAHALARTGLLRALEALPSLPGLLVYNHHRIGDAMSTDFDRGVFSSTADQLDAQLRLLKRRMPVVSGDELEALITGRTPLKRTHAVITFDDGYLDNSTLALPVLQANGCTAIFFLVTSYIGTSTVPWWDEIAFLLRRTERATIQLSTPSPLTVAIDPANREAAIAAVLRHYKRPDNHDPDLFLRELREQTALTVPTQGKRFLDWDEAATLLAAGMEIGSHTHSHHLLAQLSPERQRDELSRSKAELEARLGTRVHSLAYPVGIPSAFTAETERLAAETGYTAAYAFHGGINTRAAGLHPTRLQRLSPALDPIAFRAETALLSRFGKLPYKA